MTEAPPTPKRAEVTRLNVALTWNCTISCAHCFQERVKFDLPDGAANDFVRQALEQGLVNGVTATGGEPFLRYGELLSLGRLVRPFGATFEVVTNASWCKSPDIARRKVAQLVAETGIRVISVSCDMYHCAFVPVENILNLAAAAREHGVTIKAQAMHTNTEDNRKTDELVARVRPHVDFIYYVDYIPMAPSTAASTRRPLTPDKLDLRCFAVIEAEKDFCYITPDGNIFSCCAPGVHPNFAIGNLLKHPAGELIRRLKGDNLLKAIGGEGFLGLLGRLAPSLRKRHMERSYLSACELCHHMMSDAGTVTALNEAIPRFT